MSRKTYPIEPLVVFACKVHWTVKCFGPLDMLNMSTRGLVKHLYEYETLTYSAIVVRVTDNNGSQSTLIFDPAYCFLIYIRYAIP